MIKQWDIVIIVVLVSLSFLPVFIFSYVQAGKITENSMNVAVISARNQEIERITLTGNTGNQFLNIPEIECDLNAVEITNEQIRVKRSTCPEQICVRRGYINKPGQTIVCIPHKVIIEIETDEGVTDELIISS
ncbi:NusG domain II-containing protein [Bacillus sp. PS06]|nr:NusG domain II-containing protein [Bacillus sp. PS06]